MLRVLLMATSAPGRARADDWLAVLPECAHEPPQSGVAQLLYPRAGLPAVVPAGESLVVRARLPLPLTPPPGVQQPRALEGFEAELVGHALPLDPGPSDQRYPLALIDVRPEGPSSLRYRLAFPVPAWVAPGSYDFVLRAKGASLRADSAVRVLAVGTAPRLAWTREPPPTTNAAALLAPIDVWVSAPPDATATAPDAVGGNAAPTAANSRDASLPVAPSERVRAMAAPVLQTAGLVAALRVGGGLWVLGECEAPYVPFEVEIGTVSSAERRSRVAFSPALGQQAMQPFAGTARAWPSALPVAGLLAGLLASNPQPADNRRDPTPSAILQSPILQLGVHEALELSVLIAARAPGLRAEGGVLRFYPLGELGSAPPPVIARWSLPAGARALLLRETPVALHARLSLAPDPVRGDAKVRARVSADRALAAVALRFDYRHTAYGLTPEQHSYRALGVHRVQGVAIARDGALAPVAAKVTVNTARMSAGAGCALGTPASQPVSASMGLWAAILLLKRRLLKRRGRMRAGNRLAPELRSAGTDPFVRVRRQFICARGEIVKSTFQLLAAIVVPAMLVAIGCTPKTIPNTRVPDTSDNREVLDFVEKYRKAVEARDIGTLLGMTSRDYFDDMGTPQGEDDVDYDALQAGLTRLRQEILGARYQISYRAVTFTENQKVLVDLLYTGWFKVSTPDGEQWRRRLEPHRIVLAREDHGFKIVSGM